MTRYPRRRTPSTRILLDSLEPRILLSSTPQVVASFPGDVTTVPSNMVVDPHGNLFLAVGGKLFELPADQTTPHLAADFSSLSSNTVLPPHLSLSIDNAGDVYAYPLDQFSASQAQLFELPAGSSTPQVAFTFTTHTGIPAQVTVDLAGNIFTVLDEGPQNNIPTLVKIDAGSSKIRAIAAGGPSLPVFDADNNAFGLSSTGIYEIRAASHTLNTLATLPHDPSLSLGGATLAVDSADNFFAGANNRPGATPFIELPAHKHAVISFPPSVTPTSTFVVDANDNIIGLGDLFTVFELPAASSTPLHVTDTDTLPFLDGYSIALAAPNTLYLLGNPFQAVPANVVLTPGPPPDRGPAFPTAITLYKVTLPTPSSPTPAPPPPAPSPRFHPRNPHH